MVLKFKKYNTNLQKMSKLVLKFIFQGNQNKILYCQSCTFFSSSCRFNILKVKKLCKLSFNIGTIHHLKHHNSHNFLNVKRKMCHEVTRNENLITNDLLETVEEQMPSVKLRNILYPDSNDDIINKLKACQTVQEVFDVIGESGQSFNHEHCSQAIVIFWDLLKLYLNANSFNGSFMSDVSNMEFYITYTDNVNQHPIFKHLLHLVSLTYKEMMIDALSCSFLYLRKLNVEANNHVLQDLILRLEYLLETTEPRQFPLTALSRFAVGIFYEKSLRSTILLIQILPHVTSYFEYVEDINDFRTLTLSLRTITKLINVDIIEKYKILTTKLIENGKLTSEHDPIVVKALMILDLPMWSQENTNIIRRLLLLLVGKTNLVSKPVNINLKKVVQRHLEPYSLMVELEEQSAQMLTKMKIENYSYNESCVPYFLSGKHMKLVLKEIISNTKSIQTMFDAFHYVTTNDINVCNKYWMKQLTLLKDEGPERREFYLFGMCKRYMFFSSNMSWYRNILFEQTVVKYLTKELVKGLSGLIPSKFCQIASFLIAFDNPTAPAMPRHIVSKLLDGMDQMSLFDVELISKGLNLAMDIRRRRKVTQEFLQQYVSLNAALNSQTERFLKQEENFSVKILNKIMRAYIHRKGALDSALFNEMIKKYETIEESSLSSRGIRDTTYNLVVTNCLLPNLFDKMVMYCIHQKEHIIGDTMCKLLYACYYLGYTPVRNEEFCALAANLIFRDNEYLTGLGLLQGCLALRFYNPLPRPLIQLIFSVEFLERIDEEIKHCYAKAVYPQKVRKFLMELNRAVCLDQPEASVPWFHAKYCEEQRALGYHHYYNSPFISDVKHSFEKVTGSKDYVQTNVVSPYGYNIDLQVCLNSNKEPVDVRLTDNVELEKLAILLHSRDNFTRNVQTLKGYNQLEQRHLEILGYRVVCISDSLWNAMYMAEPKAKLNYVKNILWPSVP